MPLIDDVLKRKQTEDAARLESLLAKAERALKEERDKRLRAEQALEVVCTSVERHRDTKFAFPKAKSRKSRGDFCRVIVPDTHGSSIEPSAAAAFLQDLEMLDPAEIILMGDHLDCGGFLAQHHCMGYVAETDYSFEDDSGAANQFLDEVQAAAPNAKYDYLQGNHESRVERWIVTSTLRNPKDSKYLARLFHPKIVLGMDKRAIRYASLHEYHDGLPVQGAIRKGKCCFVHGISHSSHAASVTLQKFGGNVCFAHTHRVDTDVRTVVNAGTIGAWSFGCLCKLQPYYLHGKPSGWSHGYGLQLVSGDGSFITIQVPIIDGVSLLKPLISKVSG